MHFEKFTERSRGLIQTAQTSAISKGHQRLTPEHLLKALLEDNEGLTPRLITACGADPKKIEQEVNSALDKLPRVEGSGSGQIFVVPETARVLDEAEETAVRAQDKFVTIERILQAICTIPNTPAAVILLNHQITLPKNYMQLLKACGKDARQIVPLRNPLMKH